MKNKTKKKAVKVSQVIRLASKLLLTEKEWIQGNMASNWKGQGVNATASCATKFCLLGAMEAAEHRALGRMPKLKCQFVSIDDPINKKFKERQEFSATMSRYVEIAARRLFSYRAKSGFVSFNDHGKTTFSEVKSVLNEAVSIAQAKEAKKAGK